MFSIVLVLLACAVMVLTMRGMYRLRRGVLLSYIAGVTRRDLPLEAALAALSDSRGSTTVGSRLARRLAYLLQQGWSLPTAMRELRLLASDEVVALNIAQQSGTAAALLDMLAERMVQNSRRFHSIIASIFYPLALGLLLLSFSGSIMVFILPKFESLCKEMNISLDSASAVVYVWHSYGKWPVVGLFMWALFLLTMCVQPIGARVWWHVPLIGKYFRLQEQARLSRSLGFLLQAKVPLEQAIALTNAASAGGRFKRELALVEEYLDSGVPVKDAFRKAVQWPPSLLKTLAVACRRFLPTPCSAIKKCTSAWDFRVPGGWRPEFLWALDSVTNGAQPATTFEAVARVLEDKASVFMQFLLRVGTLLVVLFSAMSVGGLAYCIFGMLSDLQKGLL
jgi:type II secretory pathway component PulF